MIPGTVMVAAVCAGKTYYACHWHFLNGKCLFGYYQKRWEILNNIFSFDVMPEAVL
jgi:hypothetical protein